MGIYGHGTKFDLERRKYLEKRLKEGKSAARISEELGFSPNTVQQEIERHRKGTGESPVSPRECPDWSLPSGKSGREPARRSPVCDGCPHVETCTRSKYRYSAEIAQREDDEAAAAARLAPSKPPSRYTSDEELDKICKTLMSYMENGYTLLGAYKAAGITRFTKQRLFQMVHSGKTAKFGLTEKYCEEASLKSTQNKKGRVFASLDDPNPWYSRERGGKKPAPEPFVPRDGKDLGKGYKSFDDEDRRRIKICLDEGKPFPRVARELGLRRFAVERDVRRAVEGIEGSSPDSCPGYTPVSRRPTGALPHICNGCAGKENCARATLYDPERAAKVVKDSKSWTWPPEKKGPRKPKP